jgi:hypothetical protein
MDKNQLLIIVVVLLLGILVFYLLHENAYVEMFEHVPEFMKSTPIFNYNPSLYDASQLHQLSGVDTQIEQEL